MGSRERVLDFLSGSGVSYEQREFDASTKSSALAARALGCTVAEIAKSVVLVGAKTAVVVISGDKRVDVGKVGALLGEPLRVAAPGEVRQRTGFPIGGVPPFPHASGVTVLPDASLARFRHVWASAGTPSSVFRVGSSDLVKLVGRGPYELSE